MDATPKLSVLPGAMIKAERVELQMCVPMYAKSMAKACSLLSSATEHVLYHCHSHFNVQVGYKFVANVQNNVYCHYVPTIMWIIRFYVACYRSVRFVITICHFALK